MKRETGIYKTTTTAGETIRAFVPHPLPPLNPPLRLQTPLVTRLNAATTAVQRLALAGALVPSADWFLYGFVRKEAVLSSQIEGTQATLQDVLTYEATDHSQRLDDVREVCNYVDALTYARRELASPKGLPLSVRLMCEAHRRLMQGARGAGKQPGQLRRSQNWIGGTRPGNARFVPPPPDEVPAAMAALEKWLHHADPLPPLARAGLAHVQFETIHPFLDGNGRLGRLLIALLLEQWGLLPAPLLYLSLAFRRRQQEYYERLSAVRSAGDWEGWTAFYLECVREAAEDGVAVAQQLFHLLTAHRKHLLDQRGVTIPALQLLELLPLHPVVTLIGAIELLQTTKPTASKAIAILEAAGLLRETTGRKRDRAYAYRQYLDVLTHDETPGPRPTPEPARAQSASRSKSGSAGRRRP
ncbi:MAG: Fic family protein [Phycisphaerae bacterium]|nr:Fic family protein [Phycisphaerae bacterium]